MVENFFTRWTKDADGRAFTASFREFATGAEFEEMLEEHLRGWLKTKLSADVPTIS